jgi:hypothetical protein
MAVIRTLFKRTVGQHPSNNNHLNLTNTNTDSSSDTSSSNQTNDGYSSTSTLGVSTVNSDESLRRPLLHVHRINHRKKLFSCVADNTNRMDTQQEQLIDDNICLLDKQLPKELILRIFAHLDYQSLCRCAQVSKVKNEEKFLLEFLNFAYFSIGIHLL